MNSDSSMQRSIEYINQFESNLRNGASILKNMLLQVRKPTPEVAITLGSGLGGVVNSIDDAITIPYSSLPFMPVPKVDGHKGVFHIGTIAGVAVIAMQGRTHFYDQELSDPSAMLRVTFPVHLMAELGVRNYIATNAAGGLALTNTLRGMEPAYKPGELMIITDHINEMPNPLLGPLQSLPRVDTGNQTDRFQPMNNAYDVELTNMLRASGEVLNAEKRQESDHLSYADKSVRSPRRTVVHEGVYLATTGPTYETRAESIKYRRNGADAVGMSTAPEIIVAANRGMRAAGFSLITNTIASDGTNATSHDEVLRVGSDPVVRARAAQLVTGFFEQYASTYKSN